jgi:hypothetical protein
MVHGCRGVRRPKKQKVGRIAAANPWLVEMTAWPFWFSLYQTWRPAVCVAQYPEKKPRIGALHQFGKLLHQIRAKIFPSPRRVSQNTAQNAGNNTCRSKEQGLLSKQCASRVGVDGFG